MTASHDYGGIRGGAEVEEGEAWKERERERKAFP